MANLLKGEVTIKQVLQIQFQSNFANRQDYMERDVLKSIKIRKVVEYDRDRTSVPIIKYLVESFSYPQYKPYYTGVDKRGRPIKYQRSIKHSYDITLQLEDLTINSKFKIRTGSQADWVADPPANKLKTVSDKERAKLRKKIEKKHAKETKKVQNQKYREALNKRKDKADYLNTGDYNIQVKGINPDALFRQYWVLNEYGILFGRNTAKYAPREQHTNPNQVPFFNKHELRLITFLMERGILKDK